MGYVMFILAFVIGYPLFMMAAYLLSKIFFDKIEEVEDTDEKTIKEARVIKENRLRLRMKKQGLMHAYR
jgi:hypothetical protein